MTRLGAMTAACLACVVAWGSMIGSARGQGDPFEPPSIGEVIGGQLGDAFRYAQEAAAHKDSFDAEIAQSRRAYFAAYKAKNVPQDLEDEFSRLLFAKDYYYLIMLFSEGPTPDNIKHTRATDLLTGGALDGGIHPQAWGAFEKWVDAVRAHMGAKQRGQLLLILDPQDLLNAMEASLETYRVYQAKRDEAEFAAQGIIVAPPKASADAGRKDKGSSSGPDFKPAGAVKAERKKLANDTLVKLNPAFAKSDLGVCLTGVTDSTNPCPKELHRAYHDRTFLFKAEGYYELTVARSSLNKKGGDEVTSGHCAIYQSPNVPWLEMPFGGKAPYPVYSSKQGLCWIDGQTRGFALTHTGAISVKPPAVAEIFGVEKLILDREGSNTLFGYLPRIDILANAPESTAAAVRMVRVRDLEDMTPLRLDGVYTVTLAVADDPEGKSKWPLTCTIRYIYDVNALDVECKDETSFVIRTANKHPSTTGVCRKRGEDGTLGPFYTCSYDMARGREAFIPFAFKADGGPVTPDKVENIQLEMFPSVGNERLHGKIVLVPKWMLSVDPREPTKDPLNPRLTLQYGALFGVMTRVGDAEPWVAPVTQTPVGQPKVDRRNVLRHEQPQADARKPKSTRGAEPAAATTVGPLSAECTLEKLAGDYRSGYGLLKCTAEGEGLGCCYGSGHCNNRIELSLDRNAGALSGRWSYPNGRSGPAVFSVAPVCAIADGKWAHEGRAPTALWKIMGRAQ